MFVCVLYVYAIKTEKIENSQVQLTTYRITFKSISVERQFVFSPVGYFSWLAALAKYCVIIPGTSMSL